MEISVFVPLMAVGSAADCTAYYKRVVSQSRKNSVKKPLFRRIAGCHRNVILQACQ